MNSSDNQSFTTFPTTGMDYSVDSLLNSTPPAEISSTTPNAPKILLWRGSVYGLGGTIVCCLGLVGNLGTIIVLANFRHKTSGPFLMGCLAVSDIVYLLSMMFLETVTFMATGGYIPQSYKKSILPFYSYLFYVPNLFHVISIYTVVVITLERYIVITQPFKAHIVCTVRSAAIVMVCVVCCAVVFHTPIYMAYTHSRNTWNNRTQSYEDYVFHRTPFGSTFFYVEVYFKWITPVVTFLIPFIILIVFNTKMLIILRATRNIRSENVQQSCHQRERRLTWMVFCMTAVFFVLEVQAAVAFVLITGLNRYSNSVQDYILIFSTIASFGLLVNSSIDFLIYSAAGKTFRDTFKLLVRNIWQRFATCQKRCHEYKMTRMTSRSDSVFGNHENIFKRFKRSSSEESGPVRMTERPTSISTLSNGSTEQGKHT